MNGKSENNVTRTSARNSLFLSLFVALLPSFLQSFFRESWNRWNKKVVSSKLIKSRASIRNNLSRNVELEMKKSYVYVSLSPRIVSDINLLGLVS